MDLENISLEKLFWDFFDQLKFLFFPEQWNRTFLDYSKNEAFTLLLVFRKGQVNMTEIADYLKVPLNTVTGVVGRLEKKNMVFRERHKEDKRVVTVSMTDSGKISVDEQIRELESCFKLIVSSLSAEEMEMAVNIITKVFDLLKQGSLEKRPESDTVRKIRRIPIE